VPRVAPYSSAEINRVASTPVFCQPPATNACPVGNAVTVGHRRAEISVGSVVHLPVDGS
jgi:hypothetical protein